MDTSSPILIHMLGIPGAGKTTFLNLLHQNWPVETRPFLLGFDQVMQSMPEYDTYPDPVAAFSALELPARELGYGMMEGMLERRQSFLFDNGGSAATHVDILRRALDKGYRVVIVSIVTHIRDAQKRVDERAVIEGRHTPMNYLDDRAGKIAGLHETYKSLTPLFFEIFNDGQNFESFCAICDNLAQQILEALDVGRARACC